MRQEAKHQGASRGSRGWLIGTAITLTPSIALGLLQGYWWVVFLYWLVNFSTFAFFFWMYRSRPMSRQARAVSFAVAAVLFTLAIRQFQNPGSGFSLLSLFAAFYVGRILALAGMLFTLVQLLVGPVQDLTGLKRVLGRK